MAQDLEKLTSALLAAARKAGAESADAIAVAGDSLSIETRSGALEHAERSEGIDLGLRVLIGRRQACVSASDIRSDTLETMAERAVAMAREAPEDPTCGLADPDQLAKDWDVAALDLNDPAPDPAAAELEADALRAEAAARAVPGVSQVDATGAGFGRSRIHLAATNGFTGGYARSSRSMSCVAITGEGLEMERDYYGDSRTYGADLLSPEEIGRLAGERAVSRAGASKPPTGAYPVLYDERISSGLIGHLLGAISGSAITRGASWLKDAMGEQVLPVGMDLVEDPSRPRIGGSKPFDAEGLPARRRMVVEDGILKSWTLDLATARKLGLESTGNAVRGTSAPPSPGIGNVALTQSDKSRDDLLADMGTGLLVTSLIGSSINPTTGDYSRGASGFWVENGQITRPVNECTIAGNLRDMLRGLQAANDARTHLSRVVPSLLVEGLTIAGA
ncbi:TldD/PmbA family protein [Oceanomicrobium pacificus]|uniref:TldD/PmbA family protein n=1 Tax=Oceanomicrobium pacificus TaxID=2692916 RepID=A0A6B0TT39_9RHOB|nr:TldD/PmbA family protein [Oceanomicrobium pacificus]MXU64838.1 TldD/PmbA family protein [Oceanomicrobium pacificus]